MTDLEIPKNDVMPELEEILPEQIAITFGTVYGTGRNKIPHPTDDRLNGDGYLIVEGRDYFDARERAYQAMTETLPSGEVRHGVFAFDYPMPQFESDPDNKRYYPQGRLGVLRGDRIIFAPEA